MTAFELLREERKTLWSTFRMLLTRGTTYTLRRSDAVAGRLVCAAPETTHVNKLMRRAMAMARHLPRSPDVTRILTMFCPGGFIFGWVRMVISCLALFPIGNRRKKLSCALTVSTSPRPSGIAGMSTNAPSHPVKGIPNSKSGRYLEMFLSLISVICVVSVQKGMNHTVRNVSALR